MKQLEKLIYVDDSGNPELGPAVYGWIEFHPNKWASVLGSWLNHRKNIVGKYGVPVSRELHMTQYVLGRGRISTSPPKEFQEEGGRTLWKDLGGKIAEESLDCIRCIEGLTVGAVFRDTKGKNWNQERAVLYRQLLERFEEELNDTGSLGMIFMDGDGSDPIYRDAHRLLSREYRSIIEDPIYMDSKTSQLMQMADHVAWCANAAISKVPKHEFAHDWYQRYLSERDPNRGPFPL